jgi:hypothetical protein
MTILAKDHMTAAPFDNMARETFKGMAHFAGTGPRFTQCRACAFWDHASPDKRGVIKPARCKKFRSLIGVDGAKIPGETPSCRHFQLPNQKEIKQ